MAITIVYVNGVRVEAEGPIEVGLDTETVTVADGGVAEITAPVEPTTLEYHGDGSELEIPPQGATLVMGVGMNSGHVMPDPSDLPVGCVVDVVWPGGTNDNSQLWFDEPPLVPIAGTLEPAESWRLVLQNTGTDGAQAQATLVVVAVGESGTTHKWAVVDGWAYRLWEGGN